MAPQLLTEFPDLISEWHTERNGELCPASLRAGSNRNVWWRCRRDPGHEWRAVVQKRTQGRSCPVGAGWIVGPAGENSLAIEAPALARQWHPTKNGKLRPRDVLAGTHKKVWWKCRKGPDHEWQTSPSQRSWRGSGCPFCAGQRISVTNSLASLRPDVAALWHPTRNGALTPKNVTAQTHRLFWWRCAERGHEYQAAVHGRNIGGCPYCRHHLTAGEDSLATVLPKLARQWHPAKNGKLRPRDVVPGSNRRVWWKCPKGPDHEWQTPVFYRGRVGLACPFCANRRISVTNSLAARYPRIAAMWHPTRNGSLTPEKVFPGSVRRVWWRCDRGHEWRARPAGRIRKQGGCPLCPKPNKRKTVHTRRVREVVRFPGRR